MAELGDPGIASSASASSVVFFRSAEAGDSRSTSGRELPLLRLTCEESRISREAPAGDFVMEAFRGAAGRTGSTEEPSPKLFVVGEGRVREWAELTLPSLLPKPCFGLDTTNLGRLRDSLRDESCGRFGVAYDIFEGDTLEFSSLFLPRGVDGVSGTTCARMHAARGDTIGKAEEVAFEVSIRGDGISGKTDVEGELMRALRPSAALL